MSDHDDRHLEQRFAALRRQEAEQAPEFSAPSPRPAVADARPARWLRSAAATAVVLVAVLAGVEILRGGGEAADPPELRSQWTMPTDVLLDVPGNELLSQMPELDDMPELPEINEESRDESGLTRRRRLT